MDHYTPAGPVSDEGMENCWGEAKDLEKAKKLLTSDDLDPCTDANFLTRVVYALTWDLKDAAASITGIYCDQWCGVTASGQHHSGGFIPVPDEEEVPYQTFVQCDLPEWGVAKTYLLFVEKFGQRTESEDGN